MPSNLETTLGAFEERMAMRRRMMAVTGASIRKKTMASLEDKMRESVTRCHDCENGDYCRVWLEAVDPGVTPPDFCPNAGLNRELAKLPAAGRHQS